MLWHTIDEADHITRGRRRVIVVGSGVGAWAFTEEFLAVGPADVALILIERGPVLATSHVENFVSTVDESPRERFRFAGRCGCVGSFGVRLWKGDLRAPTFECVGGRSIVYGGLRSRFYKADMTPDVWSVSPEELRPYYVTAEQRLGVRPATGVGHLQTWLFSELRDLHVVPPQVEWDTGSAPTRPDNASISRLMRALIRDRDTGEGRLCVVPQTQVVGVVSTYQITDAVICRVVQSPSPYVLHADTVVVAAGAVESARLLLNSRFDRHLPAVGRYLSEHVYVRGTLAVPYELTTDVLQAASLRIPPPDETEVNRFEIELRGLVEPRAGHALLRLTGCAAVDPDRENCVTLSTQVDSAGLPIAQTRLRHSSTDRARVQRMFEVMHEVAARVGGRWIDLDGRTIDGPVELDKGRSHHEAGTLRMGNDPRTSVTDSRGCVHGVRCLRVADNSIFPTVGCVGPVLTITALAYKIARDLSVDMSGSQLAVA
jgi:choline dehydrogenase-like flavoprotein